jgi:putative salt-induced outer membrane protein
MTRTGRVKVVAGGVAGVLAAGVVPMAHATPAPEPVAAMIAAAADSGDPATLATVVQIAKTTNPASAAEIDALVAMLAANGGPVPAPIPVKVASAAGPATAPTSAHASAAAKPAAPPAAPFWKGSVELGGSLEQGATNMAGAYGVLDVTRTGPVWSQRLTVRGDYQQTEGVTTTERVSLAYEPRVRLTPNRYTFGLAQFEHDTMLGYDMRYTLGAGLGLQVADRPGLKIAVDFGPALRLTERRDATEERAVAGRGSVNIRWAPTDRVTISQEGAVYSEPDQASAKSITSLETQLFGPLKARLSYNLQYERNPANIAAYVNPLDTTTRAALLYQF